MSTLKQLQAKRPKMADRPRQQMEKHFPDHEREPLWHRTTNDGYSSIPRTLPIAMQAIYVLLLNPNIVLAELKKQKKLQEHLADRFEDRLADIGALRDINKFEKKLERLREEADDNESGKGTKPGTGTPKKKKSRRQKPDARQEAN